MLDQFPSDYVLRRAKHQVAFLRRFGWKEHGRPNLEYA